MGFGGLAVEGVFHRESLIEDKVGIDPSSYLDLAKDHPAHSELSTKSGSARKTHRPALGEEEGISANISFHFLLVVLLWIKLLPYTGWEDMLIALVPPAIDDFGKGWVIIRAFEICLLCGLFAGFGFCRWNREWIVAVEI